MDPIQTVFNEYDDLIVAGVEIESTLQRLSQLTDGYAWNVNVYPLSDGRYVVRLCWWATPDGRHNDAYPSADEWGRIPDLATWHRRHRRG